MKKTRMCLVIVSVLMICAIAVRLMGCGTGMEAVDLMEGITAKESTEMTEPVDLTGGNTAKESTEMMEPVDLMEGNTALTEFAVRLFAASEEEGENKIIYTQYVLSAQANNAKGAEG